MHRAPSSVRRFRVALTALVLGLAALVPVARARMLIARSRVVGQFGDGPEDFRYPIGIALVDEDRFWVSDWKSGRVGMFSREGKLLRPLYPEAPGLQGPLGIVRDSRGHVFVVENRASRLREFDPNGVELKRFGRRGSDPGRYRRPRGLALMADETLLVADYGNRRLQHVDREGNYLGEFLYHPAGEDLPARPRGVGVDPQGRIWATYSSRHEVVRFGPDGQVDLVFGGKGKHRGHFDQPRYMGFDVRGNVYVSDYENHRIQKFDPDGKLLYSFGARGGSPGQFHNPEAVMLNTRGDLFIADTVNYRVQILELNSIDARLNEGYAAQKAGRIDEALEHYEWVLRRVPGEREALEMIESVYVARARSARAEGRLDRALDLYRELLGRVPGHLEAHRSIRELFWERSRPVLHGAALVVGALISGLLMLVFLVRAAREEFRRRPGDRAPDLEPEDLGPGPGWRPAGVDLDEDEATAKTRAREAAADFSGVDPVPTPDNAGAGLGDWLEEDAQEPRPKSEEPPA